jgi:ABC-type dipeptide/oligopeptide/nickel transport system permease subunit
VSDVLADVRAQRRISIRRNSLLRVAWRRLRRDPAGLIGLAIAALFVFLGLFGPYLAPYDPNLQDLSAINQNISWGHPLGTDELGRDMLSRILAACRTGLVVATFATGIAVTIGVTLGSLGGYYGGAIDTVISRAIDFVQAFPDLLLAVFVSATLGPWIANTLTGGDAGARGAGLSIQYVVVIASLGLVLWGSSARLIRGQLLSLREREFVMAAKAEGAGGSWLIRKHLIPNAAGPVIVAVSLNFGGALLLEASLSFLGIGIQPPGASLGAMINQNLAQWQYHPRLVLIPTAVLAIVLIGFSLLGDALNDALDPRRKSAS